MSHWIIGIDPGKSGGMALVGPNLASILSFTTSTEKDRFKWMSGIDPKKTFAYIEKVQAMRGKDDGRKQGVSSAFAFGQEYGFLRGCLVAADIPFEELAPVKWQRPFGLIRSRKSETDTQKKNRHKAKAQQLFPGIKVTHAIADALLIAEYGRRLRGGTL